MLFSGGTSLQKLLLRPNKKGLGELCAQQHTCLLALASVLVRVVLQPYAPYSVRYESCNFCYHTNPIESIFVIWSLVCHRSMHTRSMFDFVLVLKAWTAAVFVVIFLLRNINDQYYMWPVIH